MQSRTSVSSNFRDDASTELARTGALDRDACADERANRIGVSDVAKRSERSSDRTAPVYAQRHHQQQYVLSHSRPTYRQLFPPSMSCLPIFLAHRSTPSIYPMSLHSASHIIVVALRAIRLTKTRSFSARIIFDECDEFAVFRGGMDGYRYGNDNEEFRLLYRVSAAVLRDIGSVAETINSAFRWPNAAPATGANPTPWTLSHRNAVGQSQPLVASTGQFIAVLDGASG